MSAEFTYQSNDSGYMLYFLGEPLGGAAVGVRQYRRGPGSKAKNAKMFGENARREIEQLVAGNGQGRFKTAISAIKKAIEEGRK